MCASFHLQQHGKRKNAIVDSDDDDISVNKVAFKKGLSAYEPSSEPEEQSPPPKGGSPALQVEHLLIAHLIERPA